MSRVHPGAGWEGRQPKPLREAGPVLRRVSLVALLGLSLGLAPTAPAQDAAAVTRPDAKVDLLSGEAFAEPFINPRLSAVPDAAEAFRLEDGQLQVTGTGWGILATKGAYADFHLVAEFKWGVRTFGSREEKARDGGLFVHAGPDDAVVDGAWPMGAEVQLLEGGSGSVALLGGRGRLWDVERKTPGQPPARLEGPRLKIASRALDEDFVDERGYQGKKGIERPRGQWNRLEVICRGGDIEVKLNAQVVNAVAGLSLPEGRIAVQSEGAEYFLRRLELWPLDQFDEAWEPGQASVDTGYSPDGESLLPREHPLRPEDSLAAWRIDGSVGDYELELVAAEPLIVDPVDVAWDAEGRLYVAEMCDYPLPAEGGAPLSRIRRLADEDGDGRMDSAVTWADALDNIQGLLPLRDGLLATTRAAVLFLADRDGDGRAEHRETLFRANDPRHNQLQVSSPRWGLDGWIYFNNGLDAKEVYPGPEGEGEGDRLDLARTDFRYHPERGAIEAVSGYGQYGASFDAWGRRYFCSNRNPTKMAILPLSAVRENPYSGISKGYDDIAVFGETSRVYPLSLSHTTSNAHAGTYTAACGLTVYRGDWLPELAEAPHVLVCEPTAQLVTLSRLVPEGGALRCERVGEGRDFLVSADEWTRPVQLRNGPDGALYICDMYRRFIDHARFFPEAFVASHIMRAGVDQGRLYRLKPKASAPRPQTGLNADLQLLTEALASPRGWRRETAQRLLLEHEAETAEKVARIRPLLSEGSSPWQRLHALQLLAAWDQLGAEDLDAALTDESARVVESALELLPDGERTASLAARVRALAGHEDRRVRLWAAIRLADDASADAEEALLAVLRDDPEAPWLRRAVLSSSEERAGRLVAALARDQAFRDSPGEQQVELLREFGAAVAARGDHEEMGRVLDALQEASWVEFALVTGLSEGLARSGRKTRSLRAWLDQARQELANGVAKVQLVLDEATRVALDKERLVADRVAALPLVAQAKFEEVLETVAILIRQDQPATLQQRAARSLSRFPRDRVTDFFLANWTTLPPAPRREALSLMTAHTPSAKRLMEKMKDGEINPALMPQMNRWSFGRSKDPEIKALAEELFGQTEGDRAEVVQNYRKGLREHEGDAGRGEAVFTKAACFTCHRRGQLGAAVGPDLADVRIKPPEALLSDILDPNRAVEERWASYEVETREGQKLFGLVAAEDALSVTLRMPGGAEIKVPRGEVIRMESSGLSLMPVGLEGAINQQDMADLIAFLRAE